MPKFQVAKNMWDKTEYNTIDTEDVISSIRSLLQPSNPRATKDNVSSMYGGAHCFIKKAKQNSPYIFPYTMKEKGDKLVKENTAEFSILILDIDNGAKDGKCTIEEFIDIYDNFDYYLYTSAGHSCSQVDKYRVVIPLKNAIGVEDLILRKLAIQDMFSLGGFSFVDNSAINRCRGFVAPVATWNFFEYVNNAGELLDVEPMPKVGRKKLNYGGDRKAIPGIEKHPDVLALVDLYMSAGEDSLITVNGKEYTRNDAFYKIHIEIASYNVSEEAQKELALYMDFDQKRGETPALQTVDNARAVCDHVAVSALGWGRKKDSVTYVDKYIHKDLVPMKLGGINLLTSPPGTGKTTIALGADLPVIEGIVHKVLFAAPLNSIVYQQAASDKRIVVSTGASGVLPLADRVVCSYDSLVAILKKHPRLDNYLIIADECHKIISDGYRSVVMSELVELTISRGDITCLYMSGTFDPTFLECVPFDKHFAFGTKRPVRDVNVIEVDNAVHGTTQLIKKLKGNSFVLLDHTKRGAAIAEALDIPHLHKDAKDSVAYKRVLEDQKIDSSVITTQVILEGINLINCVDNIIIVGKPDKWGVDQMVQFFERERVKLPKFYFVRTQINEREMSIKHAKSEKAYQNLAFAILKDQGIDRLRDLGVINTKGLFRESLSCGGEDKVEMNIIYPYVEQKRSFNHAVFQDPELMDEQLQKYGYRMVDITLDNINFKDAKVETILELQKECAAAEYEELVINCMKDIQPDTLEGVEVYRLVRNLLDTQKYDTLKVHDIMHNANKRAAYAGRIKYDRPKYEKAIFESFELGSSYSMPTIQAKIVKALNASWSEDLRIRKGSYIQLLNRYFGTKYSRAKKEHKLVEKIDLIRAEQIAEI